MRRRSSSRKSPTVSNEDDETVRRLWAVISNAADARRDAAGSAEADTANTGVHRRGKVVRCHPPYWGRGEVARRRCARNAHFPTYVTAVALSAVLSGCRTLWANYPGKFTGAGGRGRAGSLRPGTKRLLRS